MDLHYFPRFSRLLSLFFLADFVRRLLPSLPPSIPNFPPLSTPLLPMPLVLLRLTTNELPIAHCCCCSSGSIVPCRAAGCFLCVACSFLSVSFIFFPVFWFFFFTLSSFHVFLCLSWWLFYSLFTIFFSPFIFSFYREYVPFVNFILFYNPSHFCYIILFFYTVVARCALTSELGSNQILSNKLNFFLSLL